MLHSLTQKTIVLGGVIIVIVIAAMAVIITNNWSSAAVIDHLADDIVPQVDHSGDFNTALTAAISRAKTFARTRRPSDRDTMHDYIAEAQATIDKLDELKIAHDPLDAAVADDRNLQQHLRVELLLRTTAIIGDLEQAVVHSDDQAVALVLSRLDTTESTIEDLERQSNDLVDRAAASASGSVQESIDRGNTSAWVVLGLLLVMVIANIADVRYWIVGPIERLAVAATTIASGKLDTNVAVTSTDEIGELQQTFNEMVAALRAARAAVDAQQHMLETRVAERTADLQQAFDDLRQAGAAQEQLRATIREVSSPVVPVLDGILVMPMISTIDAERAAHILLSMLKAIEQHHADTIIVDVTGVPIIDTAVAHMLIQAANAARLLGTRTILVGLRPELAQTIVGLGVNLSHLITRADLQSGVGYAMYLQGNDNRKNFDATHKS
jgi:anti-anti-sigma regulatory factor/HAMP domain-containing protein